jgi:inositol-phosphate transport system permease protein
MEYKRKFREFLVASGFMTPAGLLVLVFFFIPIILIVYMSFTNLKSATMMDPNVWHVLSLDNYRTLFSDRFFPKILKNTFFYVAVTLTVFNVGMALLIALLTTHIDRRAGFLFRMLWLLPRLTPPVIYVMMWRRIGGASPFGILNAFIDWISAKIGLINSLVEWLGIKGLNWAAKSKPLLAAIPPIFEGLSPAWTFVILVNGFVGASWGMIIFTSAIEAIPSDYLMASKVDGAGMWQTIRHVIIPMIKWPLLFVTTYQTLSLLTSFEYILLLTRGGPGLYHTEVWALTAYKRAFATYFGSGQWAYGAAWAVILVIIGVAMSIIYLRIFKFSELVQEPKIEVV